MLPLPSELTSLIVAFAPLFSKPVWQHVQVLIVGAILAPCKRTVASALRVCGLSHERHFQTYHRVLNRASWSSRAASRILLSLLVGTFVPKGALVFAIDDTIERRRGSRIKAKGIYRDPVRSSHSHFVKASGLRWLCLMLTVRIPWAERVWALPVLTCLCPSERYYEERGRPHKKLTQWARQMLLQVKRWVPEREMVVVADSSFAALELLAALRRQMTVITRLRLDAALYEPAPQRQPRQNGRPRLKGARLPTLAMVLKDARTRWTQETVGGWYGGTERAVEVASGVAVWYHTGMPPVPVRWVLVRDPAQEFKPQALLSTNLESLCLNERGTLYNTRTLQSIVVNNELLEAYRIFEELLERTDFGLYEVKRIYLAPGTAARSVIRIARGTRREMIAEFDRQAALFALKVRQERGISYAFFAERGEQYPAIEGFLVAAPAHIETKVRSDRFDLFEERFAVAAQKLKIALPSLPGLALINAEREQPVLFAA